MAGYQGGGLCSQATFTERYRRKTVLTGENYFFMTEITFRTYQYQCVTAGDICFFKKRSVAVFFTMRYHPAT